MVIRDAVVKSAAFTGEAYTAILLSSGGSTHITVNLITPTGVVPVVLARGIPIYIAFTGISGTPASPVVVGQVRAVS